MAEGLCHFSAYGGLVDTLARRRRDTGGGAPRHSGARSDQTVRLGNERTDTRIGLSSVLMAASASDRLRAGTFPPLTLGLLGLPR